MARHHISTARFNPYSYQELAAPIERATAILSQQASGLNALEMQNASLAQYLDPELDKREYDIYKRNEAQLRNASDQLLKNGLSINTFNLMRDASLMYAQDIKPMQLAIANRSQYNAKVAELLSTHPDYAVRGDFHRPLSEFYNGIPQTQFVSGNAIKQDVTEMAKLLSAARDVTMTREKWSAYREMVREHYGYSLPELEIAKQEGSHERELMNEILKKHGVLDEDGNPMLSDYDTQRMIRYGLEGLNSLLGANTAKIVDNDLDKIQNNYYRSESLKLQKREMNAKELAAANSGKKNEDGTFMSSRTIYNDINGQQLPIYKVPVLQLSPTQEGNWGKVLSNVILSHMDPSRTKGFRNKTYQDARGNNINLKSDLNKLRDSQSFNITFDIDPSQHRGNQSQVALALRYNNNRDVIYLTPEDLGIEIDLYTELMNQPSIIKWQKHPESLTYIEQMEVYGALSDYLEMVRQQLGEGFKIETQN